MIRKFTGEQRVHETYVDYIQASVPTSQAFCRDNGHKEIPPLKFYRQGYIDALGVRRYFGNPNSAKALVVYSGDALHNCRAVKWGDRETVREILQSSGKITRIDWSITDYVDTHLVTPKLISTIFRRGHITGRLADKGASFIAGQKVGAPHKIETFYIGDWSKRASGGLFRAYDKGLDLGMWSDLITRLELEERKDNAHNSAKRYAEGASIPELIRSRLKIDHAQTDRLFNASDIDLSRGSQIIPNGDSDKNEKRWQWLMTQVAPALRKAHEVDTGEGLGNKRLLQFLRIARIID